MSTISQSTCHSCCIAVLVGSTTLSRVWPHTDGSIPLVGLLWNKRLPFWCRLVVWFYTDSTFIFCLNKYIAITLPFIYMVLIDSNGTSCSRLWAMAKESFSRDGRCTLWIFFSCSASPFLWIISWIISSGHWEL